MSVWLKDDKVVVLDGDCPSEDAEPLLGHLLTPGRTVDWRECDTAHTAVVQVLIAARASVLGPPRGSFLRLFVEQALKAQ